MLPQLNYTFYMVELGNNNVDSDKCIMYSPHHIALPHHWIGHGTYSKYHLYIIKNNFPQELEFAFAVSLFYFNSPLQANVCNCYNFWPLSLLSFVFSRSRASTRVVQKRPNMLEKTSARHCPDAHNI